MMLIAPDKHVVIHQYFDNSPRCDCCTGHMWDDDYKGCPQPENYDAHGAVEWLRFVWAMNKNIKQYCAPVDFNWDQDDPTGILGGFGSPLALFGTMNKPANLEDKVKGEFWTGVEVYENFTIYTNHNTHRCLIECYKPDFEDLFDSAVQIVINEYVGEPISHTCVGL